MGTFIQKLLLIIAIWAVSVAAASGQKITIHEGDCFPKGGMYLFHNADFYAHSGDTLYVFKGQKAYEDFKVEWLSKGIPVIEVTYEEDEKVAIVKTNVLNPLIQVRGTDVVFHLLDNEIPLDTSRYFIHGEFATPVIKWGDQLEVVPPTLENLSREEDFMWNGF